MKNEGPRGARGAMGWFSNEHPIIIELIIQFNKLGEIDGWLYSSDDKPMPQHLSKLNDAINDIRKNLNNKSSCE